MPEETSTVAFDALIQQAIRHFQNQDWCSALTNFDRLAERDPRNAEIHNYRARVLEALGRPEDALQSLDLALAISPRNLADLRNRAIVLTRLGRLTEAVTSYRRARPSDSKC
jgi:tetratricopeptide (TPR) repeat protein